MSTENTIYDNNQSTQFNENENTVFDNTTAPAIDETTEVTTPTKGKASMWRKVVIGGAAGLVFGGGATAAVAMTSSKPAATDSKANSSSTDDTKVEEEPKTEENKADEIKVDGKDSEIDINSTQNNIQDPQAPNQSNDVSITINHSNTGATGSEAPEAPVAPAAQNITINVVDYGNLEMASNVTDDMSFAQAFAAARAELGTGGVFEWHGNLYNTYTVEEWNAMGTEQQNQFANNMTVEETPLPVDQMPDDSLIAENTTVTYHEVDEVSAEPQVEVLGVEYNPDLEVNVAEVMIDDQQVYLIDVNDDDVIDVAVADLNGDGELQAEEIANVSEMNITIDDLGGYTGLSSADYNIDNDLALDDSQTPYEI